MLPTLLVYHDGQLIHNWVRVDWEAGDAGIEELLVKHRVLPQVFSLAGGGDGSDGSDDDDFVRLTSPICYRMGTPAHLKPSTRMVMGSFTLPLALRNQNIPLYQMTSASPREV